MNWNKNNNDNNPWGSGGNNNPWGSGGSGDGPNRRDFEDSIRKAKDRFGNIKFGGRRNLSIFIIVAILLWLATGFYRVEPDEQGVELLFGPSPEPPEPQGLLLPPDPQGLLSLLFLFQFIYY